MRTAVDTNILLRLITGDGPDQVEIIKRLLPEWGKLIITNVVLCELAWVLKRSYRYPAAEIAEAIRFLVETETVELDDEAVQAGLDMLESGGDFADGVIAWQSAAARCNQIVTFDKGFARIGGLTTVTLLTA